MGIAALSAPEFVLDRDRAVTLDASKARQVTAVTPKETVESQTHLDTYRSFGPGSFMMSSMLPRPYYDSMWTLPTGKKVTEGAFRFGVRWRKEEPLLTVDSGTRSFDDHVSYDDGTTWHHATLKHIGDDWKTVLHAPAGSGYVTLRTSAHDDQGNSVTQSITRAFGLK